MSTEPVVFQTAAERILAEKAGVYHFAPGIDLYAPSKAQAEQMAEMMQDIEIDDDASEEEAQSKVLAVLAVLLGEQFKPVLEYLDNFPADAYVDLFADLFSELLKLVPKDSKLQESVAAAQEQWRSDHPELFAEDE